MGLITEYNNMQALTKARVVTGKKYHNRVNVTVRRSLPLPA